MSSRDFVGYGRRPPHPRWPQGARIALQFVLNYEEGAENCVLDGDPSSEVFLSEIVNAQAFPMRHMSMESLYEYGSRAGVWRVLRAFERHQLPLTVFAVPAAVRRNAEVAPAFKELGHEIACHGLRWISYQLLDEATERAHMAEAIAILRDTFGTPPLGWYTGRDSSRTSRTRDPTCARWYRAVGMVYGPGQSQHAPPARGARAIALRCRFLRGRPAVLG